MVRARWRAQAVVGRRRHRPHPQRPAATRPARPSSNRRSSPCGGRTDCLRGSFGRSGRSRPRWHRRPRPQSRSPVRPAGRGPDQGSAASPSADPRVRLNGRARDWRTSSPGHLGRGAGARRWWPTGAPTIRRRRIRSAVCISRTRPSTGCSAPPDPAAMLPGTEESARDRAHRRRRRGGGESRSGCAASPGTPGLTALDVELLLIALVPDLDSRFERLYGYLNDDVTRRRATVGLALELTGSASASAVARARLAPGAPLVDRALVARRGRRPAVSHPRRCGCPTAWRPTCSATTRRDPGLAGDPHRGRVVDIRGGTRTGSGARRRGSVDLRPGEGRRDGCRPWPSPRSPGPGAPALCVDLDRLGAAADPLGGRRGGRPGGVAPRRRASWRGPRSGSRPLLPRRFAALAALPLPVVLVGTSTWDPTWSDGRPAARRGAADDAGGAGRAVASRAGTSRSGQAERRSIRTSQTRRR